MLVFVIPITVLTLAVLVSYELGLRRGRQLSGGSPVRGETAGGDGPPAGEGDAKE